MGLIPRVLSIGQNKGSFSLSFCSSYECRGGDPPPAQRNILHSHWFSANSQHSAARATNGRPYVIHIRLLDKSQFVSVCGDAQHATGLLDSDGSSHRHR